MQSADTLSNSQWDAHAESGVQSPQFDNIRSDWSTDEPETDEMTRGRVDSTANEVESKWIHRDILEQIESEELQAAGFIPRSRAPSKQRRDKSSRRGTDAGEHLRLRQDPGLESGEASKSALDLGTQEEVADEQENNSAQNAKGGSRIPVPKVSQACRYHSLHTRPAWTPLTNDFADTL